MRIFATVNPCPNNARRPIRERRHADRADRLRHRAALREQHVNLPKLGDDLLGLVLLLRHSWHPPSAQKPTSGKTTFQGGQTTRELGFEIGQSRELLALCGAADRSCENADHIVKTRMTEIEYKFAHPTALRAEIAQMSKCQWQLQCDGSAWRSCRMHS